LESLILVLRNT